MSNALTNITANITADQVETLRVALENRAFAMRELARKATSVNDEGLSRYYVNSAKRAEELLSLFDRADAVAFTFFEG